MGEIKNYIRLMQVSRFSLYVREDMLLHHLKIFLHLAGAVYNIHVPWEERLYIEL